VGEDKPVAPSFLLACLLWDEVRLRWAQLRDAGEPPVPALQQAIDAVFDARIGDISGRGKLAADMREIWLMQPRFDRRTGSGPRSLVEQPRFRAAFDFLRLRADVDEIPVELAEWWEDFSLGTEEEREALLQAARAQQGGAKRVKSSRARSGGSTGQGGDRTDAKGTESAAPAHADDRDEPQGDESAPRKRRRRRRRPSGGSSESDVGGGQGGST
jgi:poly(A) polymerase